MREKVSVLEDLHYSVRAVGVRILELSEIACPTILTRTGLGERVLIKSDLNESVETEEAYCAVGTSCVMTAASMSL